MPDRIPMPGLTFRQRIMLRLTDRVLWMAFAAFLMAVAFLVIAVGVVDSIENKRAEDTCRSRIAGEVQQAQGEVSQSDADVSVAVGDGLAALRNDDQVAAMKAQADFEKAKREKVLAERRLDDALAVRERSEETCDQR